MNAVYPFLLRKWLPREELFKQGLIRLCDCLRKSFHQTINSIAELFRKFRSRHFSFHCIAGFIVTIGFHFNQVDIRNDLPIYNHRNHNRANRRPKFRFQLRKNVIEVGIFIINLGNYKQFLFSHFGSCIICLMRSHFHTGFSGNGNHYTIAGRDSFYHFACKIKQTRCIQQIDLLVSVSNGGSSHIYRRLSLQFFRCIIGYGISFCHRAKPFGYTTLIQQCFQQCCFSGTGMPGKCNIFN